MTLLNTVCPSCKTPHAEIFYETHGAPVNSVLIMDTQEEALNIPLGDVSLALCRACGFMFNAAFDPAPQHYDSAKYEATQAFSRTFNTFARRQAQELIDRYDLRGKKLIEIGCGQGEFLTLMCEMGDNSGLGFDPAYRAEPLDSPAADRIQFIADFYGPKYKEHRGDLVMCKMTLEHIDQTQDFIRLVRESVGDQPETVVFFQIPNAMWVLNGIAFYDVYYEHCSYFTLGSLARLFRACGFDIESLETVYDNQYLSIIARPVDAPTAPTLSQENDLEAIIAAAEHFKAAAQQRIDTWRTLIHDWHKAGKRVALWGGSSKTVAFLTTLGFKDEIAYVIDINPRKEGKFMPGSGHVTVLPAHLTQHPPDVVIVMNPIYMDEIRQELQGLGLAPKLLSVEAPNAEPAF